MIDIVYFEIKYKIKKIKNTKNDLLDNIILRSNLLIFWIKSSFY
jgi:hypothetical protein